MITDRFEIDLHEALSRCAGDVPAEIGERLRAHRYHPRGSYRYTVGGLATVAVLAAVGAVALDGGTPVPAPSFSAPGSSPSKPGASHLRLADVTLPLPADAAPVSGLCSSGPGGRGSIEFFGSSDAAPVSDGEGCIKVQLASGVTFPAGAQPVRVGSYLVALSTDDATGVTTLYVDEVPAPAAEPGTSPDPLLELMLTAKGLSVSEVPSVSGAGNPKEPADGPSCPGGCG